jgi:hypothetical protein
MMTRVQTLREQASILRKLAESFDDQVIRGDLVRLAERCEDLANKIAVALQREASRPRSDPPEPGATATADPSTE